MNRSEPDVTNKRSKTGGAHLEVVPEKRQFAPEYR